MSERIDLVVAEEPRKVGGVSLAVGVSLLFHALLLLLLLRAYQPVAVVSRDRPIARYVELMKQNPQQFVEAPGPKVEKAPLSAPLSDANRRASMPEATGPNPTLRPGDGGGIYTPPMNPAPRGPQPQRGAPAMQQEAAAPRASSSSLDSAQSSASSAYREPARGSGNQNGSSVDWRNAIREAGKVASLGGGDGLDLGSLGGEKGFAEQGPISFETRWYDWGEYAQSMVSRIRVNWYGNMPQIIRTGMQGVVTIRFTIHRDGRITDIEILKGSGVPPYDFAARKAIELSSPLNPLPKDFPNSSERVTAAFYYNMAIP